MSYEVIAERAPFDDMFARPDENMAFVSESWLAADEMLIAHDGARTDPFSQWTETGFASCVDTAKVDLVEQVTRVVGRAAHAAITAGCTHIHEGLGHHDPVMLGTALHDELLFDKLCDLLGDYALAVLSKLQRHHLQGLA